jgi:hypothetical protein
MARLERTAERIREGAAEGIAKSLEGLPTWKPEHSEKVEKGIVGLKLWLMRDRLDTVMSPILTKEKIKKLGFLKMNCSFTFHNTMDI